MIQKNRIHQKWQQVAKKAGARELNKHYAEMEIAGDYILLYWRVFTIRHRHSMVAIFIEIYYDPGSNSPVIVGTTLIKELTGVYIGRSAMDFSTSISGENYRCKLQPTTNTGGEMFSGEVRYSIDNSRDWTLEKIDIRINYVDHLSKRETSIQRWCEGAGIPLPGNPVKTGPEIVTCPYCLGSGYSNGFAIPRGDWERGAKGYDLYSSNQINSQSGCVECGGGGVWYEDWYLEEQPGKSNASDVYRSGSGEITTTLMAPRQNIDKLLRESKPEGGSAGSDDIGANQHLMTFILNCAQAHAKETQPATTLSVSVHVNQLVEKLIRNPRAMECWLRVGKDIAGAISSDFVEAVTTSLAERPPN